MCVPESDLYLALSGSSQVQPRGVSGYVRGLTLFSTGEPMLEPFTQELPIVTEDELNAKQDALSSLGDSPEAHEARARLQVKQLLRMLIILDS